MLNERDLQAIEKIVDDKITVRIKESDDRTDAKLQSREDRVDARFKDFENRMDARFVDFENRMDVRFKDFEDRMDARFKEFEERILQESAQNMRVILESLIDKKLNLILEALSVHQDRIEQLESNSERTEALEDEVQVVKSVVKSHSECLQALEQKLA